MKIERDSVALDSQLKGGSNLDSLEKILRDSQSKETKQSTQEWHITNNNYSAIPHKELNNHIGILQIAQRTLQNILSNSHITLDEVYREINNAQFLGNAIFSDAMILSSGSGEVLFDANRVLNILPNDEKDLYIFKKALKNEVNFITQSLQSLQSVNLAQDLASFGAKNAQEPQQIKDYLTSNAMLFTKAHNTTGLIARIDALLL